MLEIREKAVSPVQLEVSPRLASPSVTSLQGTIVVFMDKTTIVAELRDVTMVAWLLRHRQVLHSFRTTVRQVAAWVLSGTWQLTRHLLQHGVVRLAVLEIRENAVSPVQLEVSPRLLPRFLLLHVPSDHSNRLPIGVQNLRGENLFELLERH